MIIIGCKLKPLSLATRALIFLVREGVLQILSLENIRMHCAVRKNGSLAISLRMKATIWGATRMVEMLSSTVNDDNIVKLLKHSLGDCNIPTVTVMNSVHRTDTLKKSMV